MKQYLLAVFLFPAMLYSQEVTYLDNPVDLLRQLRVVKIIDSEGGETIIEHTPERMQVYAYSFYYSETFEERIDSSGTYEVVDDSIYIPTKEVTDYYYNGDELLDSLVDYTILIDSNKTDTFLVQSFFYQPNGQLKLSIKKNEVWSGNQHIVEEHYFWTGQRIDSIWSYSNAQMGTFSTTYADTLREDAKFNFVYNDSGQKTQKLRYNKVVETYSYPEENTLEILDAPRHAQSGCIVNVDISHAKRQLFYFSPNGLVKRYENFYSSKKKDEEWLEEVGFSWELEYEFGAKK